MRFFIVDCFAEKKYQGNQLAVFLPDHPLETQEMQAIAQEIGFSETTFVTETHPGEATFSVRIFTPDVEVPFAGHPVIGTAHILIEQFGLGDTDELLLDLAVGKIPVRHEGETLLMTQNQPSFGAEVPSRIVAEAISLPLDTINVDLPAQIVSTGLEAIILPLKSKEGLDLCRVDYEALSRVHEDYAKCNVLAFALEEGEVHARVFMDDPGFLEDPATGSANGCLAAYLLHHGVFSGHSCSYTVKQGVHMGRPSTLYVHASVNKDIYRLEVGGKAFTTAEGDWLQ